MSILKANRIENLTTTDGGININNSGKVGIGTDSPGQHLTIKRTGGQTQVSLISDTNESGAIYFGDTASTNRGVVLYDHGQDSLQFYTAGSERMRILSGGGITFNSDTAAANALDDYEEGTWTPSLNFNGGTTGLTYANRAGIYTKIGRLVTCYCVINLSAKGSSTGHAKVGGLPFNASNIVGGSSLEGGGVAVFQDDITGTHVGPVTIAPVEGSGIAELYRVTSTSPGQADTVTNGNITNTTSFRFQFSYTTAT